MTADTTAQQGVTPDQASWFAQQFALLVGNVETAVLGKHHVVELAFTTMISGGHLLLEDVPGTGKTSLARAMSQSVHGSASRIQFTPDLLPGDVTGISVYDQRNGQFDFHRGPIFANVVLADEINRASPKTQSALLEVMEEGNVTVDGTTHAVGAPFMVIATQNPVEQAGTYGLPEAQLDRFLMRTSLGYPDHGATLKILQNAHEPHRTVEAVVALETVVAMTQMCRGVYLDALIADYIARVVEATRDATQVRLGSSTRGAIALARVVRAWALAHGRTYVTPDDVKALAEPVLAHRLILEPEAEFDGVTATAVIAQILLDVPPPTHDARA
ncbi:AAA family ATPase [Demequina gelatinilytica]|uniref:AAA family ATPase n=1 Tax=Demequina gelatinilytica TaxID=1638980 RepID=UPI000782CF92|nr:MoxR family ATPase [Demequina gelatinilytica]